MKGINITGEDKNKILNLNLREFHKLVKKALKDKLDLNLISLNCIFDDQYIAVCEGILGEERKVLISAKNYEREVTEEDLKEFLKLMDEKKIKKGLFITRTDFTDKAKIFSRNFSINLLSGKEIPKILNKKIEIKESFIKIRKSQHEIKNFFNKHRKKFLGFFALEEIVSIDEKNIPLGLFSIKEKKGIKRIYVSLETGEIYRIGGRKKLLKENFLKRILELPENLRNLLFDFFEIRVINCDDLPKKELSILEKKGFVKIKEEIGKDILVSIADEILTLIREFTDIVGETFNMRPTEIQKSSLKTKKYAVLRSKKLKFPKFYYDLGAYIEKRETLTKIHTNEKNYKIAEIKDILKKICDCEDVEFNHVVYLPYFECTYKDGNNRVRKEILYPLKFKPFLKRGEYDNEIYNFIDKMPEIPFLFLSLLYSAYVYPNISMIINVFSSSLIFVLSSFFISLFLKYLFKTERKVPYYVNTPIVKYGFPSMHSLISLGTIAFVYFIPNVGKLLSLILLPLGFLYVYSRVKLGVHSVMDVIGGAIIGLILGALFGYYLLYLNSIFLPFKIKTAFTLLFFILPAFSILYRIKELGAWEDFYM